MSCWLLLLLPGCHRIHEACSPLWSIVKLPGCRASCLCLLSLSGCRAKAGAELPAVELACIPTTDQRADSPMAESKQTMQDLWSWSIEWGQAVNAHSSKETNSTRPRELVHISCPQTPHMLGVQHSHAHSPSNRRCLLPSPSTTTASLGASKHLQGTGDIAFHFPSACDEFTMFSNFSVLWGWGRHAVMAASMLRNVTDAKN